MLWIKGLRQPNRPTKVRFPPLSASPHADSEVGTKLFVKPYENAQHVAVLVSSRCRDGRSVTPASYAA